MTESHQQESEPTEVAEAKVSNGAESFDESDHDARAGRRAAMRFVVGFVVITIAALVGYRYVIPTQAHMRYLHELSRHTVWTLGVLGDRAELEPGWSNESSWEVWKSRAKEQLDRGERLDESGPVVSLVWDVGGGKEPQRAFTFRVVPNCGAVPSMTIFLVAVLMFPVRWRQRLIGAVFGVTLLYAVNVLRLTTLGIIGAIDKTPGDKWFTFAHEYVWQAIYLGIVVGVWLLWFEVIVRRSERTS